MSSVWHDFMQLLDFLGVANPGLGEGLSEPDVRTALGWSIGGWGDGELMVSSKLGPEEASGEEMSCVELSGTAVESYTAQIVGEEGGRAVKAVGL